jgi:hypothetical protein
MDYPGRTFQVTLRMASGDAPSHRFRQCPLDGPRPG